MDYVEEESSEEPNKRWTRRGNAIIELTPEQKD